MYRDLKMEYIFFLILLPFIEKYTITLKFFFFYFFFLDGSKHFLNIKIGGKLKSNGFFSLSMKGFLKFHLRSKKKLCVLFFSSFYTP